MAGDEEVEAVAEALTKAGVKPGVPSAPALAMVAIEAIDRVRSRPAGSTTGGTEGEDHEECHCGSADHPPAECPENSLPPEGENHEAGIEAGDRFEQTMPYGNDTVEVERRIDDERVSVRRTSGARQVFPVSTLLTERYWRRVSPSPVSGTEPDTAKLVEALEGARRRLAFIEPRRQDADSVRRLDALLAGFSVDAGKAEEER